MLNGPDNNLNHFLWWILPKFLASADSFVAHLELPHSSCSFWFHHHMCLMAQSHHTVAEAVHRVGKSCYDSCKSSSATTVVHAQQPNVTLTSLLSKFFSDSSHSSQPHGPLLRVLTQGHSLRGCSTSTTTSTTSLPQVPLWLIMDYNSTPFLKSPICKCQVAKSCSSPWL
jgi:hypothetical protein